MKPNLTRSLAALAALLLFQAASPVFAESAGSASSDLDAPTPARGDDERPDGRRDATLRVYVADPSGTPTNVRDKPKGKIVGSLKPGDDFIVWLIRCEASGWCLIEGVDTVDAGEVGLRSPSGELWMHSSILGFTTRNYGGQSLTLRAAPGPTARPVVTFRGEKAMRPLGLSEDGEWVKAVTLDKKHQGWLPMEWVCGNPVTTCP